MLWSFECAGWMVGGAMKCWLRWLVTSWGLGETVVISCRVQERVEVADRPKAGPIRAGAGAGRPEGSLQMLYCQD